MNLRGFSYDEDFLDLYIKKEFIFLFKILLLNDSFPQRASAFVDIAENNFADESGRAYIIIQCT